MSIVDHYQLEPMLVTVSQFVGIGVQYSCVIDFGSPSYLHKN
jgi:hypothetical protein